MTGSLILTAGLLLSQTPAGSLVTFASSAATGAPRPEPSWYRVLQSDARLPWNSHDPWSGPSWVASLTFGFDSFFAGPTNFAGGSGAEVGVRFGGHSAGIYLGSYLPNGAFTAGVDLFRERGRALMDFGLPDMQIGILFPDLQARAMFANPAIAVSALSGLTGIRFVYADLLQVDLRGPTVGAWVNVQNLGIAFSWGLTLDAGVAF